MLLNTIIDRYILKETLTPFILNVSFFIFVFLISRILEITNFVINYKVSLKSVLLMFLYFIPYFMVFIIPMSTMMAVLLTFLKLSGDNEITALKAGGVSLYRLMIPVLTLCFASFLLTIFMTVWGQPWGRISIKRLTLQSVDVDIGLKEMTFNDSFKGVMLYINKIDHKTGQLADIFIEDRRNKDIAIVIVAPRGQLFSDKKNLVFRLKLERGVMNQTKIKDKTVHATYFDTYNMSLDLKRKFASYSDASKNEKEMDISELYNFIKSSTRKDVEYYSALIEFNKKFSIPFACIALGILAIPLGVRVKTNRSSAGIGIGIFFFLLYYLILSAGDYIVLLDGDCIPDKYFIQDHKNFAEKKFFFQGKRVLIGPSLSNSFSHYDIDSSFKRFKIIFSKEISNRHHVIRIEHIPPIISKKYKGVRSCNMGFFIDDIYAVNGFNEDFVGWGREDSELVVRLYNYGLKRKEHLFKAICYHLWHPENDRANLESNDLILSKTIESGSYICANGLTKKIADCMAKKFKSV